MLVWSSTAFILGFAGIACCAVWKILNAPPSGIPESPQDNMTRSESVNDYYPLLIPCISNSNHTNKTDNDDTAVLNSEEINGFSLTLNLNTTSGKGFPPNKSMILLSDNIDCRRKDTITIPKTAGSDSDSNNRLSIAIGFVGIFSFSLLDIGYDIAMVTGRLFVLECTSPESHQKILNMVAISQSIGGCAFCIVGAMDFPGLLGPSLGVDGTAATVLLFACFVLSVVLISLSGTVLTGHSLISKSSMATKSRDPPNHHRDNLDLEQQQVCEKAAPQGTTKKQKRIINEYFSIRRKNIESTPSRNNIIIANAFRRENADEGEFLKNGWIAERKQNYSTFSSPAAGPKIESCIEDNDLSEFQKSLSYYRPNKINGDGIVFLRKDLQESKDAEAEQAVFCDNERCKDEALLTENMSTNAPPENEAPPDNEAQPENENASTDENANKNQRVTIWRNKRLMILLTSVFFTMGTSILWNIYNGNALTIGVYEGDPGAPSVSRGRRLYDQGLQRTSLGFVVFYVSNVMCSVVSKKTLHIVGGRKQFIAYHVIFIVSLVTFLAFKREEFYFLSVVAAGIYRLCGFGLSYILSNDYVTQEARRQNVTESDEKRLLGQSVTLIGTLMPAEYLITASLMGPLMAVTGNVWVPIISCVVWTSLSLCIFLLMFCIGS